MKDKKWWLVMNATKDGPKSAPGFKYDSSTTTWDLTPNKPGSLAAINVAQGAVLMAFSRDGGRIISTQDLAIRKPSLPGRFCGGLRSAGLMAQACLSIIALMSILTSNKF